MHGTQIEVHQDPYLSSALIVDSCSSGIVPAVPTRTDGCPRFSLGAGVRNSSLVLDPGVWHSGPSGVASSPRLQSGAAAGSGCCPDAATAGCCSATGAIIGCWGVHAGLSSGLEAVLACDSSSSCAGRAPWALSPPGDDDHVR